MLRWSEPCILGGLLLLLTLPVRGQGRAPAVLEGVVADAQGPALPYANVQIDGTLDGTATDTNGRFRFTTHRSGRYTVRVTTVGYQAATHRVRLTPGDTVRLRFTLQPATIALREATVTADTYTIRRADGTMAPIEAVTTPGTMGDLFRALQSFPGVSQVNDGAGLYVRGGDLSETKTLIDQAALRHPYRYESPAGGSFGTIRPFLAEGITFSTGGFSAQYGNALSGVLTIDTRNRPDAWHFRSNAGLAAVSLGLGVPLVDDQLGLRFSGNRSFTGLLFRLNRQDSAFETVPQGLDGNLSLTYDYAPSGQLKTFSLVRSNRMGVETAEGTFSGLFRSRSTNQLHSLQWTTRRGAWTGRTAAAYSRYDGHERFGALDLQPLDATYQIRSDWDRALDDRSTLSGGIVTIREQSSFQGTFPARPGTWNEDSDRMTVHDRLTATRVGGYLELEAGFGERIHVIGGARTDHHTRAAQTTVDPRLAVEYQLSAQTQAQLAWGRFHQFPMLETHAQHTDPPALGAEQAQHWIATVRHHRGPLQLRLAGYLKPYRNLVVQTAADRYANAGSGLARGVDAFAKYGDFLATRLSGWASYSLMQSRRTQVRQRGVDFMLERGPASFDLTHQFTAVGKMRLVDMLFVGFTYRHTTGRPVTPVVDVLPRGDGTFAPVEGPVGSERLPAYRRLDLQLSYYVPFGSEQSLTVYAAMNNALDRANVIDYTYTPDYRTRVEQTTNFRRSIYFGLTVTL